MAIAIFGFCYSLVMWLNIRGLATMVYVVPNFGPGNKGQILKQLLQGGFFYINGNRYYGIDQDIDAIWYRQSITYAINNLGSARIDGFNEQAGYSSLTASMTQAARLAFEIWDDVTAISLDEVTTNAANIVLNRSSLTQGNGTYAFT